MKKNEINIDEIYPKVVFYIIKKTGILEEFIKYNNISIREAIKETYRRFSYRFANRDFVVLYSSNKNNTRYKPYDTIKLEEAYLKMK